MVAGRHAIRYFRRLESRRFRGGIGQLSRHPCDWTASCWQRHIWVWLPRLTTTAASCADAASPAPFPSQQTNNNTARTAAAESGSQAFTGRVAPGEHRVSLSVVRFDDNPGHVRVAAARLTVRPGPAATWEPALRPDEDPRSLDEEQFFGFGVDSGTGCVVDARSGRRRSGRLLHRRHAGPRRRDGRELMR
jgi:hypothetical protein